MEASEGYLALPTFTSTGVQARVLVSRSKSKDPYSYHSFICIYVLKNQ
jgi:hypothetical protein